MAADRPQVLLPAPEPPGAGATDLGPLRSGGGALLLGVPANPWWERLLAARGPRGFRPPLDVVEPEAEVLVAWLHLADVAGPVASGRVTIFAGPDALGRYEARRGRTLSRRPPAIVIRSPRPGTPPPAVDATLIGRLGGALRLRQRELLDRQAVFHGGRTERTWAARFRRAGTAEPPLRVLGMTTRYSTVVRHAMRDLARAFRRRGCAFDLVEEPDDSSNEVDTWSPLAEQPHDLLIVINFLRGQIAGRVHPDLPCVSWIQDHVLDVFRPGAGRTVSSLDRILCPSPFLMEARFDFPGERLLATSNLTDLATYDDAPVPPEDLAPFRCDLSFASHGSATVDELVDECSARAGPSTGAYLRRIADRLRERHEAHGWVSFTERLAVIMAAEESTPGLRLEPAERATKIVPIAERLFDRLVRHQMLEWAAAWADARGRSLRIHGHGWEHHPTLGRFAAGEIENGYPLRCLSQASRISLHASGYASLHQRLLDAVASGGFVLTRFNPADFIRRPMVDLARRIRADGIGDLGQLLAHATAGGDLATLLRRHERLGLRRIAPAGDGPRDRDDALLRDVYALPPALLGDDGLFASLRDARAAPPRVAADLSGFARTVFAGREALHDLLDRYVDDETARRSVAGPMRASVAVHDTFDVLVERIIESFRHPPAAWAGQSRWQDWEPDECISSS